MAGLWDWIRSLFGGAPPEAPDADEVLPPRPAASRSATAAPARPVAPVTPRSAPGSDRRYAANPEIMGLSTAAFRERALKIVPWQTAWIGRVDTIPPQSDERTALIDRGLVLRGLLTEAQLAEIHTVGDQWIRVHDAVRLAQLTAKGRADDAVAALKAERLRKKAEKQAAAQKRREERQKRVDDRRENDIVFLGVGVSHGLADRRCDVEKLERLGLPVLATPKDVADALGIPVARLRWLAWHGVAVRSTHYVTFEVPKRTGGVRRLSSPKPALRLAQRYVLDHVLTPLKVGPHAHGFIKGRSILTNAAPHVGKDVVVNLDVQDFFPTITFPRVRGLFASFGYSPAVATILALLCTESPRMAVDYDGERWHVATGPRALPQGACTSPALSNAIARKLDARLSGLAAPMGFTYTRYADDLTFSADPGRREALPRLRGRVTRILRLEGFKAHAKKGRIQRRGRRQVVTGIVVNTKPGLPREEVRRLRAILHGARQTGLDAQNRQGLPHFAAWLRGKLAYLAMVDPEKGRKMLAELDAIERRG